MRTICISVDVEYKKREDDYKNLGLFVSEIQKIRKKPKIILFVIGELLAKYPQLFKKFKKQGCEIALHGYEHERFDVLDKKEKENRIQAAIKIYKKIFKTNPKGFRAPQFSADFELLELLEKYKFEYDSSITQLPISQAIFFPSKIFTYLKQNKFYKKIKRKKMKIREVPVSSFILPVSMFSSRILPRSIFKLLFSISNLFRKDNKVVFLTHSYELNENSINRLKYFLRGI